MSLPEKEEKGYLEITDLGSRALIEGKSQHIAELEALLRQRGIPCSRLGAGSSGREALELDADADRAKAAEVLEAYKTAKGSWYDGRMPEGDLDMSFGLLALGALLVVGLLVIGVVIAVVLLVTGGRGDRDRPPEE